MAKDAELDRLKSVQESAFQRKQAAYQAQDSAWQRRRNASEALNRAHESKQRAYDAQESSWQDVQRIRSSNGPQIDRLNAQQQTAFENMKRAFDSASSSFDRGDKAAAKSYSDEGKRYKVEAQGYVIERRRLVDEIRRAKERHQPYATAFQRAKSEFDSAKRTFDSAKAEHERKQADFKQAKADFDQAAKAFKARLDIVRAEKGKRQADKRAIAEKAGVPYQYRDDVWVSTDANGNTNIYFGGVGKPNGPGHGHYVLNQNDNVTYKRDPSDQHGAQNFAENRREAATLSMARMAMNQYAKSYTTPRTTQYEDNEFKIDVKSGYSRRYDCVVTDVLIFDKQNKREHYHLVIDDMGVERFSEWRENRSRT